MRSAPPAPRALAQSPLAIALLLALSTPAFAADDGVVDRQVVHQRGDDILLFGEMIGEVAHADGKRVGNRAHGDVAVALFVEKPQGDGQNFFTGG